MNSKISYLRLGLRDRLGPHNSI